MVSKIMCDCRYAIIRRLYYCKYMVFRIKFDIRYIVLGKMRTVSTIMCNDAHDIRDSVLTYMQCHSYIPEPTYV